ncbi:hypothetical protein P152DRAFT_187908 [Eremomyces bilateralis CBS 781.70]|uniref:Uncharacterized protein n=1 Tax=Eremomyces bilateralis CBS 781.70 TaxID=1392243 RepID=A0A6G1GC09_9PEZI|nr:uncharacterized protein P152DRAFT_187908 [Eremomyces bilateralis CBS 781.70]KAF1815522.1 hypothetical protein P152DRAFT_187908 [Eremomyces bilateralis CBS 781.70]
MNKLRASIPATSPYPADLRLADLHEFEDTWYCAITIMQDLYEDVRVRMNSGFIKWDEIVHSFGKMGSSPNEPCHVYDLLEFCWMMWFYNNESDFVFTLNEAVKHRNKRDLGVASGLIDVNRQPSSITFDMLYRKHKLDRYAESERDEDRTLGEIRVALDEELWIRRMYGHEAEQRYPLNTVNTPKSAGVNTEATGTPRSATAPDLRTANASNDSKHTVVNKDAAEPTAPRRSATTSQLSPQRRRNGANGATPQRTQEDPIAADPMEIDPIETKAATTQIPAKPALNLNKPLPAIPSPKPKPSRIFKSATKAFKLRGNPLKIFTSHPKPALSSPLSSPTDSIPLTPTTASSSATASTISTTPNTSPAAFDIAALPATKPCIRQSCYPTSPLSPVQEMVREEAEGEEGIEPDEVRREREMREDYVLPRTVYVPPEGWKKEWNW